MAEPKWKQQAIPLDEAPAQGWRSMAIPVDEATPEPEAMRPGFRVIEQLPMGAFLIEDENGNQSFVSKGFSTSDQKQIKRLMRPLELAREARNRIESRKRKYEETRFPDVPGVTQEYKGGPQDVADEKKALAQERIFSRMASGDLEKILGEQFAAAKPVSSQALQFLRGVPFAGGWIDELLGGATESPGMQQMGVSGTDVTREAMAATEQAQPLTSFASQAAGGVAGVTAIPGGPQFLMARGPTASSQIASGIGRGLTAGALEGAVSGAGRADDGSRLEGAVTGAMTTGVLGAGFGAMSPALEQTFVNAKNYALRIDDARLARELGVTRETAGVVRAALQNDDFQAAQQALQRAGANSMLADASGPLRQLLDTAIIQGGPGGAAARNAVEARASQASRNFQDFMDQTLGVPEGRRAIGAAIREATAEQRQAAYDAAYGRPIDYSADTGRALEGMLARIPGKAITDANNLMRVEGTRSRQIMADIAEDGSVTFRSLPDVRQIDYIRRALGDIVNAERNQGRMGSMSDYGNQVAALSRQLREAVAESVPEYRTALQTAASTIERINAAETGYRALSNAMRPEQVRDSLRNMTDPERRAASIGLRNAIEDELSTVSRLASDPNRDAREMQRIVRMMTSRSFEEKLRIIMGPRRADEFMRNLDEELTAIELRGAIAINSKTQVRQATERAVTAATQPGILQTIGRMEPMRANKALVQALTGQTDEAMQARQLGIYDEIAMLLTQRRGRNAQDALTLIERAIQGRQLTDTQARIIAGAVLRPGALVGASATAQELRYKPETDDFE